MLGRGKEWVKTDELLRQVRYHSENQRGDLNVKEMMLLPGKWLGLLMGFGLLLSSGAFAQIPLEFSFRGNLSNSDGVAIDCSNALICSTPVSIVVRVYDDPDADISAAIYEETHPAVFSDKGVFDLPIGIFSPLDPADYDQALYLGISINGEDEALPRIPIRPVPSALVALDTAHLGGVPASDYVSKADFDALQAQLVVLQETVENLENNSGGTGGVDPETILSGGIHTVGDCSAAEGILTEIPGDFVCRFVASSCPEGWTQLENWSTTQSVGCAGHNGEAPEFCPPVETCTAFGHPFSNEVPKTCCAGIKCGKLDESFKPVCISWQACSAVPCNTCTASVVEIGCF